MTVVELPVDRVAALEAKIDLLTEQMAVLTAEAEQRRRQREAYDDLTRDLARVGEDAMVMATRELESLSQTADPADTVRLVRRLVEVAPTLDRALVALNAVAEFVDDAAPMGTDVLALATERLAEAERKGYFAFITAAARMKNGIASRMKLSSEVVMFWLIVTRISGGLAAKASATPITRENAIGAPRNTRPSAETQSVSDGLCRAISAATGLRMAR